LFSTKEQREINTIWL